MGHDYIGHNYIGHNYIAQITSYSHQTLFTAQVASHNYIGHIYIRIYRQIASHTNQAREVVKEGKE